MHSLLSVAEIKDVCQAAFLVLESDLLLLVLMVLVTVNLLAQSGQFLCSAHPTLILSASVCCACCHVVVDREPGRSPILSGRVLLTVLQP